MAASSCRGKNSSQFHYRKNSSSSISSSRSESLSNNTRLISRSGSSSTMSFYGSGSNGGGNSSRSVAPIRNGADSAFSGGFGSQTPVSFPSEEELIGENVESSGSADSISVTVRFRPMNDREYDRGDEISWYWDGDKLVRSEYNPATAYAFDRVFGDETSTQEVYEVAARPVVKAAMEGVNGTVFAYGVTSSGKTHTMHGDQNCPGIIPLAIKDVFSMIQDTPGSEFLLRVSYIEIYNEVINDLLDPTGQNLRIREDAQGTYVEGIKEEVVLSPGHALSFIAAGEEHRHVGSNNFNLFSSRSHTIFTLMIESSAHGDEYDGVIFSQLNLIDLAGSESSKTETTGLRRKEGSYINKSLLTLGTVIGKLSEGKSLHVPYRDSKLTRLLQSSLSGHGHVSLICTVTPASSSMEETHNTLKFASRAKRVEIFASRNKIIDEKSLIKKYQREISCLKQELDQFKRGMLPGVDHEELITLKQKLEEGQVRMQSRLEEEEEAKVALMSRIQRLTKLILVSSKNSIPGYQGDVATHSRDPSVSGEEKLDALRDGVLVVDGENRNDSATSISGTPSDGYDFNVKRSSSLLNDDISQVGSRIAESYQGGELLHGSSSDLKLQIFQDGMADADQMDLLVEHLKMLAGEIAFNTSSLKRLVEQSVEDPESSKTQIQTMEREIQEKKRQMRILEQRIVESSEASVANSSLAESQQTVMKLMSQCSEQSFELEIKTADNRILQEQLQSKCFEIEELQEKIGHLEQQLASISGGDKSLLLEPRFSDKNFDELRKKIQSQEIENEKLKLEHVQILEENSGMRVQNQKLSEEASYAKELASAAAVELKNLAGEVTKLSLQNAKLEKELTARERNSGSGNRKYNDRLKPGFRSRTNHGSEINGVMHDDFDSFDLDPDDLKMELHARKQREIALEAALAEKDILEDEYRKKAEESKRRETSLENDLANMWVLVAQLKREAASAQQLKTDDRRYVSIDNTDNNTKAIDTDTKGILSKDAQVIDHALPASDMQKEEPLVARLKARIQEMKEKEHRYVGNGDTNSHVCKVCFESSTAAMLLPCRHFCLCKSCSLACSECPICRTSITDRIFAFT